jgi:hypothetical protein
MREMSAIVDTYSLLFLLSDGVQFRLSDRWYGKVQVKHNGEWGRVCNANWGNKEASTLCRQLGYVDGRAENTPSESPGKVRINDVNCTGSESSILECSHHSSWTGSMSQCHDAEVICEIKSTFFLCVRLLTNLWFSEGGKYSTINQERGKI